MTGQPPMRPGRGPIARAWTSRVTRRNPAVDSLDLAVDSRMANVAAIGVAGIAISGAVTVGVAGDGMVGLVLLAAGWTCTIIAIGLFFRALREFRARGGTLRR